MLIYIPCYNKVGIRNVWCIIFVLCAVSFYANAQSFNGHLKALLWIILEIYAIVSVAGLWKASILWGTGVDPKKKAK